MEKEQLDMAYAAGAIDGDGSLFICRRESSDSVKYVAGANIGKSCKELIDFFQEKFSGNMDKNGGHYRWGISSSIRMIPFLERIVPYLVTKKEQAETLLKWFRDGMPDKEETYIQMKKINGYTVKAIDTPSYKLDENPLKWAYLAGLMDTDGSFMINKRLGHNGMKNPNYLPKVSYGESDSRPLTFIRQVFPFGSVLQKESSSVKGGRFVWELVVKDEISDFISRLLPFMKVKKPNAEIVLDFCRNFKPVKKGHRFGIPPEELTFREKCYQDLQRYQRR